MIGGAHGGIPDIVEDGVTGLLVPHGDAGKLAQAFETLFNDPARAWEMAGRGRERVEQQFSFAQFQARLTQLLDEVLAEQQ